MDEKQLTCSITITNDEVVFKDANTLMVLNRKTGIGYHRNSSRGLTPPTRLRNCQPTPTTNRF